MSAQPAAAEAAAAAAADATSAGPGGTAAAAAGAVRIAQLLSPSEGAIRCVCESDTQARHLPLVFARACGAMQSVLQLARERDSEECDEDEPPARLQLSVCRRAELPPNFLRLWCGVQYSLRPTHASAGHALLTHTGVTTL